MAEERSGFDLRRDGGGLLLFGAGAFLAVLSVLALTSDVPPEEARGTSALAQWWTALLGPFPSLVIAVAAAGLGARSFLAARLDGAARVLLGALGLAAALAIGFSSVTPRAGGALGDALGGTLARTAHPVAGVLLGLVVLAATVWFAWLRDAARAARESAAEMPAPRPAERAESVSTEEAAALLPAERAVLEMIGETSAEPQPEPPSPYPEDVRLRGQVPEGARPIGESRHAPQPPPARPAAPAQESVVPLGLPEAPAPAPTWRPHASAAPAAEPEPLEDELDEALDEALERVLAEEPDALAAEGPRPPRPSWEQSSLFEEEIQVDAYGTPLELVEELEEEAEALALDEEEPDEEEPELEAAELEEDEDAEEDEEYDEDELVAEADEEEEPEEDELEAEAEAEAEEEPVAVAEAEEADSRDELEPRPMPPGELERRLAGREKLVYQAGQLFLERGRVAVSMLQREYQLTFDEACGILDELQERGLIGPYLGGKHRDILLTSEEWLERVSTG